jgi:signal transduction histidine kinase/putative methionine-R-sulfoxide reductase with GAF domain
MPEPPPDAPLEWAFEELARLAAVVTGAPMAALGLVEADRAWFPVHIGLDTWQIPPAEPFLAEVIRGGDVLVVEDASSHASLAGSALVAAAGGVRFLAGVPIPGGAQPPCGALLVMDTRPRALGDRERQALQALGRQAAALVRLRSPRPKDHAEAAAPRAERGREPPRDVPRRTRLLAALGSSLLGTGVAAETGPYAAQVCEAAVRSLFAIPDVDHCALFLLDPSRHVLEPALWYGYPTGSIPVQGASIVGRVARTGEQRNVPDVRHDADYLEGWPDIRSELALPLRAGGEIVGVLNLESRKPSAFSPAIMSLCESVGHGISAALEGTNITELLLRAKLALEMTFDAMPELVAILDHDVRIRRLNKSLARHIGRPLRELIGEPLPALLPFCAEWLAGAAGEEDARGPAELQEPRTGAVYEANLLQIHGPTPILGERVVILRDVTEQREMARRMAAFERRAATGDLLSGVAHEVRNPLAAVQAAAEALGLDAAGDPDQTMLVDIIQKQVDRLSTLMRDLLEVARPSPPSARRRESLVAFCRAALDAWTRNPARRPRVVHLQAPPGDELPVLIEPQRIEQVLVNLLDNAAAHSPEDSPIQVELARRVPDLARVRAIDRGTGLPPAGAERMFEPFFTTRPSGTGLGLTIARSIVEDHGGSIGAWNNDPGPGLTVEFTLPLAPES